MSAFASGILGVLVVAACLAVYVPIAPLFPSIDLDGGWAFALNVAVERGLVFGRDIVFTLGPYGAAYTRLYYAATDTMMLASTTLLAAAFASALLCLAGGWMQRLGALLMVALMAVMARDALFFALPFTLVLLVARVAMPEGHSARIALTSFVRVAMALLVLSLSLIPLVKGTFAVSSGVAMAICVLMLVLRRHWALAAAGVVVFVVAMPLFWLAVGQPLSALPDFFISQGPIVSGYTEAMSVAGGLFLPAIYLACCALLAALYLRAINLATIGLGLGTAAILFFAFKGGFVRADGHMLMSAGAIVIISAMLAFGQPGWRPKLGVLAGLAIWALIDVSVTSVSLAGLPSRVMTAFSETAEMAVARITRPEVLGQRYRDSVTMIASRHSLPELRGTTDIYAYGQSILLARDLPWAPRPVLQSYSAYTPSLAQDDATFLAGPKAPDNVLFTVETIDNRLPSLDDGLSWPELLTRYDFIDLRTDMAIMRRREQQGVKAVGDTKLSAASFQMGEMVKLPEAPAMLWAKIDVAPTFLGKLVVAAFRPPRLNITFRFADGHDQSFRYIPGMGKAGFLVAPIVSSTQDFVSLTLPKADEYLAGKRPVAFTINADRGVGLLWNPTVTAEIFPVRFPVQDVGRILFDRVETEAARLVKLPTTPDCSIDLIDMQHPANLPVKLGAVVQVDGWAAVSVKNSMAPDATYVTLTAPSGEVTSVRAKKIARNDVNAYFQKPTMGDIGYTTRADLGGLSGDYLLSLKMTKGDDAWTCTTQVPVRVTGAAK